MTTHMHASPLPNADRSSSDRNSAQHSPGPPNEPRGAEATQARRLQLRNAGFRGPSVRQVTPKSLPSISTTASNLSSTFAVEQLRSPDAENVSPSGIRAHGSFSCASHEPSAALQDIGNAADTVGTLRAKRARPRVTSAKFFTPDGKHNNAFGEPLDSPPATIVQLSTSKLRTRVTKMSSRPRRSLSAESRRYIDHLEEELSAAQAQLQAVNSPTITREHSSNVRHMKAEVARLRDEIEDWETMFDDRVREEVCKCHDVEQSLRAQLRTLEEEFEVSRYRIHELECQLSTTTEALDATETANVNMEKRIEFFSDLLAASPTKIDLHAQTPGRPRPSRPQSIVPRFPTANYLARSPERHAFAQPISPIQARFSPGHPTSPVNMAYSPDVVSSEEGSIHSDMFGFSSSIQQSNAKKPMRRMRRFGAGSMGPKPLILPSTAHCEQIPASAPPFDRGEYDYNAAFPFPVDRPDTERNNPMGHHRSASSMTSSSGSPVRLTGSPFPDVPDLAQSHENENGEHGATIRQHSSPFREAHYSSEFDVLLDGAFDDRTSTARSQVTSRNFDSLGSAVGATIGRNLFDELEAAQSRSSIGRVSHMFDCSDELDTIAHPSSSPFVSNASDDRPHDTSLTDDESGYPQAARFPSNSSTQVATIPCILSPPVLHYSTSSKPLGVHSIRSMSTLDSMRGFFGDIVASPLSVAKHLVERAQTRLQIPRPLLSIQWWLVGFLLGPMAKRRFLARTFCRSQDGDDAEQHLLADTPSRLTMEQGLEYGQLYQTPPPSSSSSTGVALRSRGLVAGKGKKRASSTSKGRAQHCSHVHQRWKHSPLLWLKFSMTLAIAVGIAFKDGPSSLLKEALCTCKPASGANWRQTKRDAIASPNDG